jgi:D-cysteine desulfhydrase
VLPYPARIPLALTPTPVEPLPHLARRHGVELLVKRDDLTGAPLTGNKVRKLEFLLAEAKEQRADTVITCGGAQSNHCRATAIAARRLGMHSVLLLRVPDPSNPPPVDGNLLLDRLVGAEVHWVTPAEYEEREALFSQVADELRAGGRRPYVVPEGGSNALGAWGYVRCVEELQGELPPGSATLVYAAGSGGTGAGLILGVKLMRLPWRVVGFNVSEDRDYFVRAIGEIVEEAIRRFDLEVTVARDEIEIVDGYVGRGYAQSRPEELRLIADVARAEALLLDPVYTGKAFYGMTCELERDPRSFGERIVFLHTGGIFGLFPKAEEMAALL